MTDYVTLLQRRLVLAVDELRAAARAAYQRGRADGYEAGWLAAMGEVKRTDRDLIRALNNRATRWVVRGQKRTRATYGRPHPGDYPGMLP